MDPSLILAWREPVVVAESPSLSAWAAAPAIVAQWYPRAVLSPASAAALIGRSALPAHRRVEVLLAAGLDEAAWNIARQQRDVHTRGVCTRWAHTWLRSSGLSAAVDVQMDERWVVVGADSDRGTWRTVANELHLHLPGLIGGWDGPLLIAAQERWIPGSSSAAMQLRPALPVLRLPSGSSASSAAQALATFCVQWNAAGRNVPLWLADAAPRLAAWSTLPGGISPRAMGERRAEASDAQLLAVFQGTARDADLAAAVLGWCVDARRADQFPGFFQRLCDGMPALSALLASYRDLSTFR